MILIGKMILRHGAGAEINTLIVLSLRFLFVYVFRDAIASKTESNINGQSVILFCFES